jgi:steroid delta-isomerase-like uncharacterized protein
VLTSLNQGDVSAAIAQFADEFIFHDYALDLEFTQKGRLAEFFQKSRELFPDTVVEVVSTFECGEYAIAEWKLTATETAAPYGSLRVRLPISLSGASVAQIENGSITRWSDYYDQITSRRISLAAFFTEWIEY